MQVMWKTGIVVRLRVEAGVIAERSLAPPLARLDVALEHDVRARRHFEIDGDALHHLDAALRARNPPSSSSSSPSGIGAVAQYGSTGSGLSATATSSRLPSRSATR